MCPAPRVLPLRATEHPTEGTYSFGAIWKIWRFLFVQKLWREKANKLISTYVLTATSYGANGATFRQKFLRQGLFWFFQSLTAGYKLRGIVRQRATSLSAVQDFCFCSLLYTFRYMFVNVYAFSEPRARATAL